MTEPTALSDFTEIAADAGESEAQSTRPDCAAPTDSGDRCTNPAVPTLSVCHYHVDVPAELAESVAELLADPLYCTTCATQVREIHEARDEAEAIRLSVGDTTEAFQAAGHRLAADGTVDANHRHRPTHAATIDETPDGRVLFCSECGRRPDDAVDGSRPQDRLVDVAHRLSGALGLELDSADLTAAVDAVNDADTDDPTVIATALLRAL
jgi:hypothetical protein